MDNLEITYLKNLADSSKNPKILEFAKYYQLWNAFFERVLNGNENDANPNIHSLVNNLRLIILSGFAENLGEKSPDLPNDKSIFKNKFTNFLNHLNIEEKFYFCLVFEIKITSEETNKKFQAYLETGSEELLDELMQTHQKEGDEKEADIRELLKAFYNDETQKIQKDFDRKVNLLYGIRSKIVHTGSPVIGAVIGTGFYSFYGEKENNFFSIKKNLDDFFLRAALRQTNNEPEPIYKKLKGYLNNNYLTHHADLVGLITYKKLTAKAGD